MRKLLRGPRRWYALLGVMGAATAVAVGLTVSMVGAADAPSIANAVSAQAAHAKASGAAVNVDMGSVPQLTQSEAVGEATALKDLSPLGEQALEQAKQNAGALAPLATDVIAATPADISTPGGATKGWEGMANSGTICSYFGPGGCQPPDHGVASDGVNAIQTVNTSIAVYDAKTGALKAGFPKSLQSFFGVPAPSPAGCDASHGNQPFLSDPRAFYDPVKKRFWVAALQLENAFGIAPNCTFLSKYWVAASASSDPTGVWHVYNINTANIVGTPNTAADYTQLGFNQEAAFIGGNQFTQGGSYVAAWTLAIPKAKAEAGLAIGSVSGFGNYTANDGNVVRVLDTVQPVASYGAVGGPAGEILVASFNESVTENKIVVFDFSNALAQQASPQTISGVVVPTLSYSQPPNADNFPSCTNCLETIDNRISATPVYMHGNVYFSHDSAVNNGTAVNANQHWGVIHPVLTQPGSGCTLCSTITASTSVVENAYLTYAGTTDDWFGAIQPDREGNIFIGFEYGSTSGQTSPSSVYIAKRATATGFPDGGVFLRHATNATTNSRWGDYEAVGFESWNSNNILFATEYAGTNGNWATHLDRVTYKSLTSR